MSLAFLSVGARNFETGLSLDGPVYATVARQILNTKEWFLLDAMLPDFIPFVEHPHLGFWVMAAAFKVVPVQDWSARIVGHLYYIAFLLLYFLNVRKLASEAIAAAGVVMLWSWYLFSNTFSNVYLDPGTLFFGSAAVFAMYRAGEAKALRASLRFAIVSGICLGLCTLYKGLTVLGFGPAMAYLALRPLWESKKRDFKRVLLVIVGALVPCALLLMLYVVVVQKSNCPNFLSLYWGRQMTRRFGRIWALRSLFEWEYWRQLLNYTYYLAPLTLVTLPKVKAAGARLELPWILSLSFIFMFAPARLWGGQYLVMIFPWVAWLIAEGLMRFISWKAVPLMRVTGILSVTAVLMLQYIPVRTHGNEPLGFRVRLNELRQAKGLEHLIIDKPPGPDPFVAGSSYAWYTQLRVEYFEGNLSLLKARPKTIYVTETDSAEKTSELQSNGWCLTERFEGKYFWWPCGT